MGRGIVQVTVEGGMVCKVFDAAPGAAAKAKEFISGMLGRAAEKGRMTPEAMQKAVGNVQVVDSIEALADCDVVVEAIVEKLEAKKAVFAQLDGLCGPDTILASRSEERRVGKACVSPCSSRWTPYH